VELGSGASKKIRLLLDILRPAAYLGIDISREFLLKSTRRLACDYPWLEVHAACLDFSQPFELKWYPKELNKLVFFPGSSIGNLESEAAVIFLKQLRPLLEPDGALLIGVDLKKDPLILHAAYNDAQGVTAAFNLNLLHRIQRELDTDLVPERFEHSAFYNQPAGRIEMHLVSPERQRIRVEATEFSFEADELLHTESSYKYSLEEFHRLAAYAGYRPEKTWTDARQWFSVHYLRLAAAT
jgi:dimethylhistidine N-methyltransferase